jgi:uncharacterized protein YkwD
MAPLSVHADATDDELADMINMYRAAPGKCDGHAVAAVKPLAIEPLLASLHIGPAAFLASMLKDAGYQADRAEAITITGPTNARDAMGLIKQKYCDALLSTASSAVGTARSGNTWQIILTHPVTLRNLPDVQDAGQQILAAVNAARAQPRSCGATNYGPAQPLSWNPRLTEAALAHSDDMAEKHYFDHRQPDGSKPSDRALRAGYRYARVGENIASGQRDVAEAMTAWLASPGHCANIMNPRFTEMGAAYAINTQSQNRTAYWTQVLAAPRGN